ncbi:MAG: hypothetical protein ACK5HR_01740 [Mycoplasmatales bacterium]
MINKLKINKINKYYLGVLNEQGQRGSIYIAEVSNFYISDLTKYFQENDIIYGKKIGMYKQTISYSLKIGHDEKEAKYENGGGFLVLKKFLNDFERKENDKIK